MLLGVLKRRIGVLGAFFYSGANFFLAFVLQSTASSSDFGSYAFALVLIQFGISVSNALFASPIVVWFQSSEVDRGELLRSYFCANLVFVSLGPLFIGGALLFVGMHWHLALLVMAQAFMLWLRWFFRAIELASHNFVTSALSDVIYGICTFSVGLTFFLLVEVSILWALVAMLTGTITSASFIGQDTLGQVSVGRLISPSLFVRTFRSHGSWALTGVIATEITANLHSYVLTIWLGPAAFAPVATISLFFRPIMILMQALTQFERPIFARLIGKNAFEELADGVGKFTSILLGSVFVNSIAVASVIYFASDLIGGGQYALDYLWWLLLLLSVAQFVRASRAGPSAAVQAAGRFRPLAYATITAAPVTILGTCVAIAIGWKTVPMVLAAVLLGELITAIFIRRVFKRLLCSQSMR